MKPFNKLFLIFYCFYPLLSAGQCIDTAQHLSDLPSTFNQSTFTVRKDNTGRPYLYIASKEGGLKIADISNPALPVPIDTIPTSAFNGYHVMSLTQSGQLLYLALGNIYDTPAQGPALAVIDISDPTNAFITDTWYSPYTAGGCGIVEVEGTYAYLGGMFNGLIILDISDANNVTWQSDFLPSMVFPHGAPVTHADSVKYNVRGLSVRNDTVYACYDRGGFRVIDVSIKTAPVQIAQYCNPSMIGFATAYNNVVLNEGLAYVAIDYQGIEVLDISVAGTVSMLGSWKGPAWPAPTNNPFIWLAAEGHANEIRYDAAHHLLFVATGKSDLHIVDVSVPSQPDSCSFYGGVNNNQGTWGLDYSNDTAYLAYIFTAVPFQSNWTGIKTVAFTPATSSLAEVPAVEMKVYPNPAKDHIFIELNGGARAESVELTGINGKTVFRKTYSPRAGVRISGVAAGMYTVRVKGSDDRYYFSRILVP